MHTHHSDKPQLAIIEPNTLAAIGLASIIERMMPMAEARVFASFRDLAAEDCGQFFHYFVAARVLLENALYFGERQLRTIVLVEGETARHLPAGFHTINVGQSQERFLHDFMLMQQNAHGDSRPQPEIVKRAKELPGAKRLTRRETEVLRYVVKGLMNKEIAERMGVGLTTIISHRKNLCEKLGTKSISALTVYAVSHGIVKVEEI